MLVCHNSGAKGIFGAKHRTALNKLTLHPAEGSLHASSLFFLIILTSASFFYCPFGSWRMFLPPFPPRRPCLYSWFWGVYWAQVLGSGGLAAAPPQPGFICWLYVYIKPKFSQEWAGGGGGYHTYCKQTMTRCSMQMQALSKVLPSSNPISCI